MNSLKVLFEMFMPEARFPDEKFWDKDGNAIHPEPKGPPKGTVGKTHADFAPKDNYPSKDQFDGQGIYPNIDSVRDDMKDAYRKLQTVLKDIGTAEQDIPEDAFIFDEDGVLIATLPGGDGLTHEIWWNEPAKHWEYVT